MRYTLKDKRRRTRIDCQIEEMKCIIENCNTVSSLHPFCSLHLHQHLGLAVKKSKIHGAGCGLFTTRRFLKGDVIAPYTGRRSTFKEARKEKLPRVLPYALRTWRNRFIDASCIRGAAAYINGRSENSRHSNAYFTSGIIHKKTQRRFFSTASNGNGMCIVLNKRYSRYYKKGWRRIHESLLKYFTDEYNGWVVAERNIPVHTEIIANYRNNKLFDMDHNTTPSPC